MPREITVSEFTKALAEVGRPGGKQLKFLKKHATAPGRALNMASIARAAGYVDHRGGNLQYGLLGARIGEALGRTDRRIGHLVEFVAPKGKSREHISNEEWILVMRPNFAKALKGAGWI